MIAARVVKRISDETAVWKRCLSCPASGFPELRRNTLQALRLAKKCGDRVAIVSLSERPWVFESADQYLPGPIEEI